MFQFARGARILLAMAIRVALIGTGNCGSLALRQLIEDQRFELTDVWVSTPAKVGKDAGELARLDVTTGVQATADLDAVPVEWRAVEVPLEQRTRDIESQRAQPAARAGGALRRAERP